MTRLCNQSGISVFALLALAVVAWGAGPVAGQGAAAFAEKFPRAWCGVFHWRGDPSPQHYAIRFTELAATADGKARARGPALVLGANSTTELTIEAVIDPANLRIEMFERLGQAPSPRRAAPGFTTDGSHKGTIAADLRSMRTVWTQNRTRARGDMTLDARPDSSALAELCARPVSDRGPGNRLAPTAPVISTLLQPGYGTWRSIVSGIAPRP